MELLCALAGNPERCAPSIHIAGSKGKGSVTGMITAALEADGFRPARYMSPHVSDIRERLCVGNSFFDEAVYCAAGDELRNVAEVLLPERNSPLFDPSCADGEAPTYFELLTLLFFLCARRAGCDAMVVETGMGGRLDSTNVVNPLVSVITIIELEHTKYLGDTIAKIAGEKAGIIKPGRPLVLAKQCGEALEVFKQKAAEKNSPLVYIPDSVQISDLHVHSGGTDFTLAAGQTLFKQPLKLSIGIPGVVQAENAALAVAALKTAFPGMRDDSIRRGLENFRIPARFEKIADNPPLIIDGAHTPQSAALCAETFCSLYGKGGVLLFGCAADKNAHAMAEVLLPCFSVIVITAPGTFKASDPEKVYGAFCDVVSANADGTHSDVKIILEKDTGAAIQRALELSRTGNLPGLVTGSFYLAAEARNFIEG
ncbi:MAG: Mur ligase family protein [Treponema sp.]|nr:Mur ligase family protein [Treponema sp.]